LNDQSTSPPVQKSAVELVLGNRSSSQGPASLRSSVAGGRRGPTL